MATMLHPRRLAQTGSWSRGCTMQQIRAEKNLSFIESRKLAVAEQQQSSQTSLASVVSSSRQRQFKSVEVQTNLTWPGTADKPIQVTQSQGRKSTATASTSTATHEDAGSAGDEKLKMGGKGKTSHPKITRPPPSQSTPVTNTNRYAVLGTSPMEEGEPSSSVIK